MKLELELDLFCDKCAGELKGKISRDSKGQFLEVEPCEICTGNAFDDGVMSKAERRLQ